MVLVMNLTVSLAAVEVAQYLTFTTARVFGQANLNITAQMSSAQNKWNKLIAYTNADGRKPMERLTNNGWLKINTPEFIGMNANNPYPQIGTIYGVYASGVRSRVEFPLLKAALPMLGAMGIQDPGARVFAPTVREVNMDECQNMMRARASYIMQNFPLASPFQADMSMYISTEDAGC